MALTSAGAIVRKPLYREKLPTDLDILSNQQRYY
jgi:hypothetical protein